MTCKIFNKTNTDFGDLDSHIEDMYGFFSDKYSFNKHPSVHLKSDEANKAEILGKTAYYDPQSLQVHVYVDGRHAKDILRSIAHELIHHHQNLEGRLDVGGYSGPGYYLENDGLKELEHEAMLKGNADMREWEDTKKYKENNQMSLKEWKNNELNKLMLKKFKILKENDCLEEGCGDNEEYMEEQVGSRKDATRDQGRERDDDRKRPMQEAEDAEEESQEESSEETAKEALYEAIKKITKAKKVFLNKKRIK